MSRSELRPSPDAATAVQVAAPSERAVTRRPTLRGVPDLIGVCVALPAGLHLASSATGDLATLSAVIFSLGLLAMLLTSGLYHTVTWGPRWLARMSRLDHAAIFVFIAATYTPFCLCTGLPLGPHLLGLVWLGAALGALNCLFGSAAGRAIKAGLYVLLGVAMVPWTPWLFRVLPGAAFALVICGGAIYILGASIYVKRWPNPSPRRFGYHEVFHLFVFGGAACHYAAIWRLLT